MSPSVLLFIGRPRPSTLCVAFLFLVLFGAGPTPTSAQASYSLPVVNPSFESPRVWPSTTYTTPTGWKRSGGVNQGITTGAIPVNASQIAFVRDGSGFLQSVNATKNRSGWYAVRFTAARNSTGENPIFRVLIDGVITAQYDFANRTRAMMRFNESTPALWFVGGSNVTVELRDASAGATGLFDDVAIVLVGANQTNISTSTGVPDFNATTVAGAPGVCADGWTNAPHCDVPVTPTFRWSQTGRLPNSSCIQIWPSDPSTMRTVRDGDWGDDFLCVGACHVAPSISDIRGGAAVLILFTVRV